MFADTLTLELLKGFINESFSSCSSVKTAQMHMDGGVCSTVYHHAQLPRRPGKFGTAHLHFIATQFKAVHIFSPNRHMGGSWPVEELRDTLDTESRSEEY